MTFVTSSGILCGMKSGKVVRVSGDVHRELLRAKDFTGISLTKMVEFALHEYFKTIHKGMRKGVSPNSQ